MSKSDSLQCFLQQQTSFPKVKSLSQSREALHLHTETRETFSKTWSTKPTEELLKRREVLLLTQEKLTELYCLFFLHHFVANSFRWSQCKRISFYCITLSLSPWASLWESWASLSFGLHSLQACVWPVTDDQSHWFKHMDLLGRRKAVQEVNWTRFFWETCW